MRAVREGDARRADERNGDGEVDDATDLARARDASGCEAADGAIATERERELQALQGCECGGLRERHATFKRGGRLPRAEGTAGHVELARCGHAH